MEASDRHEDLPRFSGTRGAYWQLHCSICGSPLLMYGQRSHHSWLENVLVLPTVSRQFTAISVNYVDGVDDSDDEAYLAWGEVWEGEDDDGPKSAIPIHKACLELAESVVKSTHGKPFSDGGPPASLLDVMNVLKARLVDYHSQHDPYGMFTLPEPSGYRLDQYVMDHEGWDEDNPEQKIWMTDPTDVSVECPPPPPRILHTFKVPPEILKCIFGYTWEDDDASKIPKHFFPSSFWHEYIRRMAVLRGVSLPDECDWEELARRISSITHGENIPGLEALRNRIRIWNLIAAMRLNDNFDIQRAMCGCRGDHCLARSREGDKWCQGSWAQYSEKHGLDSNWIPTLTDMIRRPLMLDDNGEVVENRSTDDRPLPEYIVNSKKNASLRAWLDSR